MSRIQTVNPANASGKSKELLDGVTKKLGMTPNLMRVMANSPSVLEAYLGFSGALGSGELPAQTREQIALTVGQANSCDYCLSAHSALGKMVGLSAEQVQSARRGTSDDPKTRAILSLAKRLVEKRGLVSDEDLSEARDAGVNDAEIAETVANTALNLFTNYFNHVAQTEIDFPVAETLEVDKSASSSECSVA